MGGYAARCMGTIHTNVGGTQVLVRQLQLATRYDPFQDLVSKLASLASEKGMEIAPVDRRTL